MRYSNKVLPFKHAKRRNPGESQVNSQLLHGSYVAEFYVSKDNPPVYHHLITEQGSREILFWGQCRSQEEAEHDAYETMRSFSEQKKAENNLIPFPEDLPSCG